MRNFTRMGFVAVSAAFLSVVAQSAASAQDDPNMDWTWAAQSFPNEEMDTTVNVPRNIPNRPGVPTLRGIPFLPAPIQIQSVEITAGNWDSAANAIPIQSVEMTAENWDSAANAIPIQAVGQMAGQMAGTGF
jgi:hypothetical protein